MIQTAPALARPFIMRAKSCCFAATSRTEMEHYTHQAVEILLIDVGAVIIGAALGSPGCRSALRVPRHACCKSHGLAYSFKSPTHDRLQPLLMVTSSGVTILGALNEAWILDGVNQHSRTKEKRGSAPSPPPKGALRMCCGWALGHRVARRTSIRRAFETKGPW